MIREAVLFLILTCGISWPIWFVGIHLHWREDYLLFGVAGPAIAAIILSGLRQLKTPGLIPLGVALYGWLILLSYGAQHSGGQAMKWNPWLILPALLPAFIAWIACTEGSWLRSLIFPGGWKWPVFALLSWPVFLLVPAALMHVVGGRVEIPLGATLSAAYISSCTGMFTKQLLFAAVLEEPGWRGYLLPRLQQRFSPLISSIFICLALAVWHQRFGFIGPIGDHRVYYFFVISILMTWLYNRSGKSLATVTIFHAGFNTFPFILPYAPSLQGLIFLFTLAAVISSRMWRVTDVTNLK